MQRKLFVWTKLDPVFRVAKVRIVLHYPQFELSVHQNITVSFKMAFHGVKTQGNVSCWGMNQAILWAISLVNKASTNDSLM